MFSAAVSVLSYLNVGVHGWRLLYEAMMKLRSLSTATTPRPGIVIPCLRKFPAADITVTGLALAGNPRRPISLATSRDIARGLFLWWWNISCLRGGGGLRRSG
nr:MAG TPA: hypothetical protein [Caudoviricetes sp.]